VSAEAFPLIKTRKLTAEGAGSAVKFPSRIGETRFALVVFVRPVLAALSGRSIE